MASDVYEFAVMAWEVRTVFVVPLPGESLNGVGFVDRFSLGDLRSPMGVSSQELVRC